MCHAMDTSISWPSSLCFFLNRAWGCEDMSKCLDTVSRTWHPVGKVSDLDQYLTLQQAFPWIIILIFIGFVQEYRPLIPRNSEFACAKLLPNPKKQFSHRGTLAWNSTCCWSDQSTPAGHRSAPVISCRKPRFSFLFRWRGGISGWPGGRSQSMIADFKLFVSSERAFDVPCCSWFGKEQQWV